MNITTLIDNFSDNNRILYKSDDQLIIKAQGKVIYDFIIFIIFSLFLIQATRLSLLSKSHLFTSLLFVIFIIVILVYKTRGNNKLIIKLSEKTVVVKKRSSFFFLIPTKTIKFSDIISFEIVLRTNYLEVRSYKSYEIIAKTKKISNQILISFLEDEKNNANQVLCFLKSLIVKSV